MSEKTIQVNLHVAHASQLQLVVDAVALALRLELGDLAPQRVRGLRRLGSIRHLLLERRDPLVALGDCLLPVNTAHLRLLFLRLLAPEVFLGLRDLRLFCAMCISSHTICLSLRQTAQSRLTRFVRVQARCVSQTTARRGVASTNPIALFTYAFRGS